MAEAENWQRYGPFDLGMHDYMDEFDFRRSCHSLAETLSATDFQPWL